MLQIALTENNNIDFCCVCAGNSIITHTCIRAFLDKKVFTFRKNRLFLSTHEKKMVRYFYRYFTKEKIEFLLRFRIVTRYEIYIKNLSIWTWSVWKTQACLHCSFSLVKMHITFLVNFSPCTRWSTIKRGQRADIKRYKYIIWSI